MHVLYIYFFFLLLLLLFAVGVVCLRQVYLLLLAIPLYLIQLHFISFISAKRRLRSVADTEKKPPSPSTAVTIYYMHAKMYIEIGLNSSERI